MLRIFELSKDRKILRQRIFRFFIQNDFNLKKKQTYISDAKNLIRSYE